ncbi:MAG: hypothetical protein IT445_03100 [Phycisphaeraceae bacterium]|nr:hypothetical protein [Phycisphaeraceae bacterium]
MKIKVTKITHHKDGSPRWKPGTQITISSDELQRRGVPAENYEVIEADPQPAKK